MTSSDPDFLIVDSITAAYEKGESVVADVSFSLKKGELACLLGPSGCGKTTVLRAISGFQKITSGSISLDKMLMSTPELCVDPIRRRVGMVFQDHTLFPHLSIEQNIGFGLNNFAAVERERIIQTMLDLIGLQGQAGSYPHELSGGQNQRVALARAIAPKPKLLLLDEPFSNLDAELRESLGYEVRTLLKELDITALMVTHDQQDAFALGDRIGVMSQGMLKQWGSSEELYQKPNSRFIANFIGDGVLIKGHVTANNLISTCFGDVKTTTTDKLPIGKEFDLLIRPEDVLLDPESTVQATVARKVFKGAETLTTLRIASGEELTSLMPSQFKCDIGDTVGIKIEPDYLVFFARNTG